MLEPPAGLGSDNLLAAQVLALNSGPINCELLLALAGGERLAAVVTRAASEELGLAPGRPVWALPLTVLLATGGTPDGTAKSTAKSTAGLQNHLAGVVETVQPRGLNARVGLRLAGGSRLQAVVTTEAVAVLGLAPGVAAWALIPASQVLLVGPSPQPGSVVAKTT
ncbi:MAG: TOBE domain-containing protein [Burkholderiaceae bacterium]|nr:TOBE domain-containing protein [Burkholderiaceae bacterium]